MLNLKTTGYAWVIACLLVLSFMPHPWEAVGLLTFLFMGTIALGSFHIGLNFFLPSVNHIKTEKKVIALTFDDGPSPSTLAVLEVLAHYGAKATFFCIGAQIEKHPEILLKIHDQGHLIGNHSFSHVNTFPIFSVKKMVAEIERTNEQIQQLTGIKPEFFRPPFGVTTPRIAKALLATHMKSVGWNRRSLDTVLDDPQKILQRTAEKLQAGDIVLFHDPLPTAAATLEAFLLQTAEKGWNFERIDTLVAETSIP